MPRRSCGESSFFGCHRRLVRSLANHGQVRWGMCPIAMRFWPHCHSPSFSTPQSDDLLQFEPSLQTSFFFACSMKSGHGSKELGPSYVLDIPFL